MVFGMNNKPVRALLVFALLFSLAALVRAQDFDSREQAMIDWIDAHQEEAITLLEKTVNIGSGTMNLAGVREVGQVMEEQLASRPATVCMRRSIRSPQS